MKTENIQIKLIQNIKQTKITLVATEGNILTSILSDGNLVALKIRAKPPEQIYSI